MNLLAPVRVLLLNQVFYPDVAATAQHGHDLAQHLVKHGHEVVAIASRSIYGQRGASLARHEHVDGVEIHRVGRSMFGKSGLLPRLLDFALFYILATLKAITIRRPDVVVCFTTPPFIALTGWLLRLFRGSRYVYWVMDLYPDVLVANGSLKPRSPLTWLLERISRWCLRKADRVVVLGRCMRERVLEKSVADPQRVVHIGVWSDDDEVVPAARHDNPFRRQWEVGDRFLVMYSGNFGIVHDVRTMCDAARLLKVDRRIVFAFVGGGKRKGEVEAFVREHGIEAHIEPYQPRERLSDLLSAADVHIVSLLDGYEGLVVPSKMFGIMAASRPALVVGPSGSEIARVAVECGCGRHLTPGDSEGLAKSIAQLADNPREAQAMGARGREALRQHHSRSRACTDWRLLLEQLVNETRGERTPAETAPPATASTHDDSIA